MNIDRAVFLALATSLAAVACSSEGQDSGTADSNFTSEGSPGASTNEGASPGANTNEGASCWEPTTEGTQGEQWYVNEIGFDPVNDYPAAESFCYRVTSDVVTAETCSTYAKVFVPATVYSLFYDWKDLTSITYADTYAAAKSIAKNSMVLAAPVCVASGAEATCEGRADVDECIAIFSQMKPDEQELLVKCLEEQGWDAYTCVEGGF